ncbi:hypothetical protein [Bradyrhizobium canariense]|nr:hypothetical protein [Bradyrhizobium canariense]
MRTYDTNASFKEKREALDLWATHLISMVEGAANNVVPIRA